MSNVFSNASFAVLSVMHTHNHSKDYVGSTVFVQVKPEDHYPNVMIVEYPSNDTASTGNFDYQSRFEANICSNIMVGINEMKTMVSSGGITLSNANISPTSYKMSAVAIT